MGSKIWVDSDSLKKYFEEHTLMLFRPCLGQPCLVEFCSSEFRIVVVSKACKPEDVRQKLQNALVLSEVGDEETTHQLCVGEPVELLSYKCKDAEPCIPDPDRLDVPGWHLFSTGTYEPPVWFFEVPLTIAPLPVRHDECAFRLYNLDRLSSDRKSIIERKHHAVCLTNRAWDSFKFIHVSDMHTAKRNDQIFDMILASKSGEKERKDFTKRYVNFNDHLRRFVEEANKLARKGKLDFILMTGDLIDYVKPSIDDKAETKKQTNWRFFHDILTGYPTAEGRDKVPLRVPIFTVLGNHDFRFNHYRLSDGGDRWKEYGLKEEEFKQFDRKEPDIKFPKQLEANIYAVRDYLLNFNPYLDYAVNLGEHRMICLDSGEDEFTAYVAMKIIIDSVKRAITEGWRAALTFYLMRLREIGEALGGIVGGGPESSGLFTQQIEWVCRVLDAAGSGLTFVAMHSPPVNKPPKVNIEDYSESQRQRDGKDTWIDMDDVDLSAASISWNWHQFLNLLASANEFKKAFDLVLCGHTHCNLAFRLKKYKAHSGRPIRFYHPDKVGIYTDDYAQDLHDTCDHKSWWKCHRPIIMQTPSLGPEGNDKSLPGYRLIQVEGNVITNLDYYPLRSKS
jgi:predicted MPP superfamily phosphohydrolase